MAVDDEVHRPAPIEVESVDLLAGRAAGVRTGGRGGGAGDDCDGTPDGERANAEHEPPVGGRGRRVGVGAIAWL